MPENNCSQKVVIRNLCGPMRHESWQKSTKGISDNDELKYYLCVKSWLCKQEVASSGPTGTSVFFFAIISTMIGLRVTE